MWYSKFKLNEINLKQHTGDNMKITPGMRLEIKKSIVVITEEEKDRFIGYAEYNGENVGEITIFKSTLDNPHYLNSIKAV